MTPAQISPCELCGAMKRVDYPCPSPRCITAREEEISTMVDAVLHEGLGLPNLEANSELRQLRKFRHMVACAVATDEHYRDVRAGRPYCFCGLALDPTEPTEAFVRHVLGIKACRICACTDADCGDCIARTGQPCHWIEPDLCSACA